MDWLSFFCGMGAAICLLFLLFLFLPIRGMEKAQKDSNEILHEYWGQNQILQERQSVALESIADRLLKWVK
jgi:Na+-transporting methylmalonyl-CoA/oxaloacetate decarboxylase gamma subunit